MLGDIIGAACLFIAFCTTGAHCPHNLRIYDMTYILNPYNHTKGTLCVARMVGGENIALKIEGVNPLAWNGVFSIWNNGVAV